MKEINIRALVADTLLQVEQEDVFLSAQENFVLGKYSSLDDRDRGFFKMVCDGVCERRILIDYILDLFSKTPVKKMKPYIRAVLRMSVYQLMWMENVPDSAVCNEAVKLVSSRGMSGLKGYVNGVLRNISRNKDNISYPDPDADIIRYLSVMYSCPEWIVLRLIKDHGEELTRVVLKDSMEHKPVSLRLRLRSSSDIAGLEAKWADSGVIFSANPYIGEGRFVEPSGPVNRLPGYEDGSFVVQDTGSMMVSILGCTGEEHAVMDLCGAPGGKSVHTADIIRGARDKCSAKIQCLDISENRCRRITENIDRLGLSDMITVGVADASVYNKEYEESFDLVIADVPCSGLGVMGHKPDIKYRLKPEDIDSLALLQRQIIDNAVRYVRPGGRLIYSTCTVTGQENVCQAEYIIETYGFKDITAVCVKDRLPSEYADAVTENKKTPGLQIIAGIWRSDGFYIAVFEKEIKKETK